MGKHGLLNNQQVITVGGPDANFDTIQAAIDSVSGNTSTNWFHIVITPGVYVENIVMKPFVSLSSVGNIPSGVIITGSTGPLITFPSGGSDVTEISFLTLALTPTTTDQVILSGAGGLIHLITDCIIDVTSATNDIVAQIADFSGGFIQLGRSNLTYTMTGSSAGVNTHNIFKLSGTASTLFNIVSYIVNVDDVDDTVNMIDDESSGNTNFAACLFQGTATNASYAGIFRCFNHTGGVGNFKFNFINEVVIQATSGLGTGESIKIDTSTDDGTVFSHHTQYTVLGFGTNSSANVGTGDTVLAGLDIFSAADGNLGAGSFVGSLIDADFNFVVLNEIISNGGVLRFLELSSVPATLAGYGSLYTLDDDDLYFKDANGVIYAIGGRVTNKSYSFTSPVGSSGVFFRAGFYEAPTADANLTQASTTATVGIANVGHGAHAFIVGAAAGATDAGVVEIEVSGTSFTEAGVRTTSDTEIIVADITTMTTDGYIETTKQWIGTVTFTLQGASGSPTTFNADFNYGLTKYEDVTNSQFILDSIEVEGLAGATDTGFDIELLHHKATGWTYAATGFIAGDGAIAQWSTDYSTEDNIANGEDFSWKRTGLNTSIDGSGSEGIVIRITTTANKAIESMDIALGVIPQ